MQVWDNVGSGFIQYDAAHLSEATMGHVAENGVVQHALMQRLLPNVERLWPVSADMSCVLSYCAPQVPDCTALVHNRKAVASDYRVVCAGNSAVFTAAPLLPESVARSASIHVSLHLPVCCCICAEAKCCSIS